MKSLLLALSVGFCIASTPFTAPSQDRAQSKSLREPGFLFLELGVENVVDHVAFFERVGGFHVVTNESNWAWLQSDRGDLMFGSNEVPNKSKPIEQRRVVGVEIGVVVADLDQTFAEVEKFQDRGFRLAGKIERRPWGPRDFRVYTPDGYYIRITEPM
jgi:hypothetical protein